MKTLLLIAFLLWVSFIASNSAASAEGLLSRLRSGTRSTAQPSQQPYTQTPARSYPTRNLQPSQSRLPSGRSYYQGRYYGNFNNRFYGPQYGYF